VWRKKKTSDSKKRTALNVTDKKEIANGLVGILSGTPPCVIQFPIYTTDKDASVVDVF